MPSLGADMEVGTIVEWRVQPGDTVHRGDIVAVVDTEKSDIEVEIFEDGVIEELVVAPGVEVPVGAVLARLTTLGASAPAVRSDEREPPRKRPSPAPERPKSEPTGRRRRHADGGPEPRPAVRASPLARRQAAERGVDLAALVGSGPGGAVLAGDVERAEATSVAPPADRTTESAPPRSRRRVSAQRATGALMARSKQEIPHYYLASTIDVGRAMAWLADVNASRPPTRRLLPAALLLKAAAVAAREVPLMNGVWCDGFEPARAVHLGVAVALRDGGLVAPAIRDADSRDLDGLMDALRGLVERARAGTLRSSEVSEATITVTNLGDQGADEVYGVIYPPQVALVGFGRIVERPWACDGLLGVRPVVRATLSADHRVSDGRDGSEFLAAIGRHLSDPAAL
jgi:pyruvate dehydrogenase E2 component (dihydrolipoamide acetyltransferase)